MKTTIRKWTTRIASAIMAKAWHKPVSQAHPRSDDARAARGRRADQRRPARRSARAVHRAPPQPGDREPYAGARRAAALEGQAAAEAGRAGGAHHRAQVDLPARMVRARASSRARRGWRAPSSRRSASGAIRPPRATSCWSTSSAARRTPAVASATRRSRQCARASGWTAPSSLLVLSGYYTTMAMVLNSAGLPLAGDAPPPLKP